MAVGVLRPFVLLPVIAALLLHTLRFQDSVFDSDVATGEPPRVLLLTAHPDDEAMFFAPTILSVLFQQGTDAHNEVRRTHISDLNPILHSLCLSTGNADGSGEVRIKELENSLDVLGVQQGRRWVIDSPHLQDNITVLWGAEIVADAVRPYVLEHHINTILTFDPRGISSHPNHAALPHGVLRLLASIPEAQPRPKLYALVTHPILPKYTGLAAALYVKFNLSVLRLLRGLEALIGVEFGIKSSRRMPVFVSGLEQYLHAIKAMRAHSSQLVWFRVLYILFSRYMWVNDWVEMKVV